MDEASATAVADALNGDAWQSGGGIWLVVIHRRDGHLVVISDDAICEYESEKAFEESKASTAIRLVS